MSANPECEKPLVAGSLCGLWLQEAYVVSCIIDTLLSNIYSIARNYFIKFFNSSYHPKVFFRFFFKFHSEKVICYSLNQPKVVAFDCKSLYGHWHRPQASKVAHHREASKHAVSLSNMRQSRRSNEKTAGICKVE